MNADRQTEEAEFDRFAETYEDLLAQPLRFFGDEDYFAQYKVRLTSAALPCAPRSVLDFGCGIGRSIPFLRAAFPDAAVYGFDVSRASIDVARERHGEAGFFSAETIPADLRVDLVFAAGVFHHIAPADREDAVSLCASLLVPGGSLVVFEHNPYNPVTRRIVSQCPLDENAVLLRPSELCSLVRGAGLQPVERAFTLFFPRSLDVLRPAERYLRRVPLGGQYYVRATCR